jgi:hypothetical protein
VASSAIDLSRLERGGITLVSGPPSIRLLELGRFSISQSCTFPRSKGRVCELSDAERDERSGDEWLLSAMDYCDFRAGVAWRKLHRTGQRSNPTRSYYLDGIRLLSTVRSAVAPPCSCKHCAPLNARRAADLDRSCLILAAAVAMTVPKRPVSSHLPSLKQVASLRRAR